MAKKNLFPFDHNADVEFFDQNYLEPERILYTTAMFPIIYPEKSNLIKGKWQERCIEIVMIFLNYRKGMIKFGIYFIEAFDS